MSLSGGTLTPVSDTSKSISSKSYESEETQRKVDFTSDNSTSPLDIESNIQAERITKILDGMISRTKLALCIPSFVKDYKILKNTLTPQHLEEVLYITAQYNIESIANSVNDFNTVAIQDMKNKGGEIKTRLNAELGHLLFILNSSPKLHEKVDEIVTKMTTLQNLQSNPGLQYLLVLTHFRNLMVRQLTLTATEELKMKMKVRKYQMSNASLIKKIQRYSTSLSEELRDFENTINHNKETISRLHQESQWLQSDTAAQLKKQILDSDRQMVLMSRKHETNRKVLEEEEVDTMKSYNTLLQDHMANEKNQRLRRFKVETQLITWIQKYDLEMSVKDADYQESKDMYNKEVERVKELEEILTKQNLEYYPLMEEKEKEYTEEMTQKLKEFTLHHAARVLQVAWKTVLQNRTTKTKLRKIQNKLKTKVEIEERKREKEELKKAKELKKLARKNKGK